MAGDARQPGRRTLVATPPPTRIGQLVTYLARVTLAPTPEPIRVGMSVTARIATRQVNDVVLVRNRFVRIDRATQQAFVTLEPEPGVYREIPVDLGARNELFSEVISGLNEGQRIVLLPRDTFIPGLN